MFCLIKKVFIAIFSFSRSLPQNFVSFVYLTEQWLTTSTLIDLNPVELNYYPFMFSLDKCNGICNDVDDLYSKIYVVSGQKAVNVKVFNMITRINEFKTLVKHISCDCKCKVDITICNSNQKWNNDKCQCESKIHRTCKEDSWKPSTCICENSRYLKNIVEDLVVLSDEIIRVANIVPTNVTKLYQKTSRTMCQ